MPAASLVKFHVSQKIATKRCAQKIATKRCADRRNELGGSSCHAFSENLHLIHTSAEGLKMLFLALCEMCIVRNGILRLPDTSKERNGMLKLL